MNKFLIDSDKVIKDAAVLKGTAPELRKAKTGISSVKGYFVGNGKYWDVIGESMEIIMAEIIDEAAKMDSAGKALELISQKYRAAEQQVLAKIKTGSPNGTGTDKRDFWAKLHDFFTFQKPDSYEATGPEQQAAADLAMQREMWAFLQDERFSEQNWKNYTVDEKKQLLQEYMDKVIQIYGLQDVKPQINWDSSLKYEAGGVRWGQYSHGDHTVTLNENVLTDSISAWDSYHFLETVGHELRHAYQHEAIERPTDFQVTQETIDDWANNFDNYISPTTDHQKYEAQPVEVDARNFGVDRNGTY